jgi:RHS repeat-associated protein
MLGPFLQPDSLIPQPGNLQAWNRYAYVYNNRLRYMDPTGTALAIDVALLVPKFVAYG